MKPQTSLVNARKNSLTCVTTDFSSIGLTKSSTSIYLGIKSFSATSKHLVTMFGPYTECSYTPLVLILPMGTFTVSDLMRLKSNNSG